MTLNKWTLLLAAVITITAPGVSYAQFGALGGAAKNKAVEKLTNEVMEELEKKFTELVAKEPISDAAKANTVAKLSEMSRPIVKKFIDGATSGKLPNPAELAQTVLSEVLPRVPELVAAVMTEGGGGAAANSAQATPVSASTIQPAARPETLAPDSGDGVVVYNRHCYVRFDRTMTWMEAKAYSESLGGHLVTITSQAEQEAVYLLIKDGKKNFYWLGGYREGKNWQYVTGENFSYNNWISGRPDNANNREDKLIMVRASPSSGGKPGQWDDFTINGDANNMGYICEFDNTVQSVTPASTQTAQQTTKQPTKTQPAVSNNIPSESAVVFAGNGHKYEVFDASKTWSGARDDCKKRGGYLVTITSNEEQEFIQDLLSKQGKKFAYWIGGYREAKKNWQWVTGESFSYTNWAPGQPQKTNGGKLNRLQLYRSSPDQLQWMNNNNGGSHDDSSNQVNYIGYICEWD